MREVGFRVTALDLCCAYKIIVDQKQRHDFVRVSIEPHAHLPEPIVERTNIEKGARCVAQSQLTSLCFTTRSYVYLRSEKTDASVQLYCGVEKLVAKGRETTRCVAEEGRVVRTKMRDLVVANVAQLRGVVACASASRHEDGGQR
jgi:hypothetical protein